MDDQGSILRENGYSGRAKVYKSTVDPGKFVFRRIFSAVAWVPSCSRFATTPVAILLGDAPPPRFSPRLLHVPPVS